MKKRGAYYRRKSMDYYRALGYRVVQTEISRAMFARGRMFFQTFDLFGADLAAWNDKEFIFVQVKSSMAMTKKAIIHMKSAAKVEFEKQQLPPCVRKQVIIWRTRQKPIVYDI